MHKAVTSLLAKKILDRILTTQNNGEELPVQVFEVFAKWVSEKYFQLNSSVLRLSQLLFYHEINADSVTQINNSIIPENQQSFKTAALLFFIRCMEPQSAGMAHLRPVYQHWET